jgi:MSHA pilin protein MshD
MSTRSRARGVTLVELIVFMVIVGVAMAGIFAAFSTMTKGSADPQVRKQVLAIAESMMEEIVLMPLTYCDPDDPLAATAANAAACTTREDTPIGNESETRYSTTARFDNVSDYHGFVMDPTNPVGTPGIRDVTGTSTITGLDNYSVSVSIANAGTALGLTANEDALRITVTASHTSGVSMVLEGYRTRYAPNTTP